MIGVLTKLWSVEGPRFSSVAESNMYRSFGAALVNMTNIPEVSGFEKLCSTFLF